MESAQRIFLEGYLQGDRLKAVLAMNMIAHHKECGIDDMRESRKIFQTYFFAESVLSKLPSYTIESLGKWVPIFVLLSNCNFMDNCARRKSADVQVCLLLALERANTALNLFVDSLRKAENNPHFGMDIGLLVVLCERMRVSVRHLSSFGSADFDPLSLYRKVLLRCYAFLSKTSQIRIKNATKNELYNGLAYVLTELLRIFPFSIGAKLSTSDVRECGFYASRDKAALLHFFYAMHLISFGNLRDAESALAKAASYRFTKLQGTIVLFWTVLNMQRGHIPRKEITNTNSMDCLEGIVVALITGRVDVFDVSCCLHMSSFLQKNLMLLIVSIRHVVLRNMICRHQLLQKGDTERIYLEELWSAHNKLLNTLTNSPIFPSLSFIRDGVLLPLLVQRYINGCLYIDHGLLNLPGKNAFPEIELPSGPLPQPAEPSEK